jgi:hypothetical protein
MRKCLLVLLVLLLSPPLASTEKTKKRGRHRRPRPTVTFVSPVECKGDQGKWRWKIKTEKDKPPEKRTQIVFILAISHNKVSPLFFPSQLDRVTL